MKSAINAAAPPASLIPDFSSLRALCTLAAVMELIVVVLMLAAPSDAAERTGLRFLQLSAYLQGMGLGCALALGVARRRLAAAQQNYIYVVCWLLLLAVTALWSALIWQLNQSFHFGVLLGVPMGDFVRRNIAISAIVSLLLLRYFWERHQWEDQTRSESEARYLGLQARIRPHFLFNCLNSISALISTQPEKAEELVADLADLFRASLDERSPLVTLAEEIEIVKGYLRIEEARLENRLRVQWEIAPELLDARIPRLTIQPLVENAIYHGISRLAGDGLLHVSVRRERQALVVDVDNPLPPDDLPTRKGTGLAVNNIVQRIKLIYGEQASLTIGPDRSAQGALFRARLRLPYAATQAVPPRPEEPVEGERQ